MRVTLIGLVLALAALAAAIATPSRALQPDEVLPDRQMERRARDLSAGLRCLVCQNQSIDDSDAPLARDLRLLVRERLKAGDSDAQVKTFVVQRYGDFVLLKPPFKLETLVLWLSPLFVFLAGGMAIVLARRSGARAPEPLSASEQEKLDGLLREAKADDHPSR